MTNDLERALGDWFERASSDPQLWKLYAKGLFDSAEVLRAEYEHQWSEAATPPLNGTDDEVRLAFVHRSALLLYGFAIENLLKGLRVVAAGQRRRRHVQTLKQGIQLQLGGHDLVAIADAAAIPMSRAESELLRDLTEIVTWSGRYHLPRRSIDFGPIVDRRTKTIPAATLARRLLDLYPSA